ncbi:unnamed protein product [Haemonchus placei]|uniref:SCP domain-containing protein n=1 Tax=Haemonchus placei TaxID=6290 RepID=A0A0N4X4S4_HAEPC|nr:unnamed protein product [Haemonchus placei]
MLSTFIPLLLILENVATISSEKPFPEDTVESFKTLNMRYNDKLAWSDEWAKKALEWLKSPEKVKDDLIVIKGKELAYASLNIFFYYEYAISTGISQKRIARRCGRKYSRFLNTVLIEEKKSEGVKIARLPAGTLYGCNGIIDTTLKKKESIYTACLYMKPQSAGSGTPLPKETEETFKTLNSMYSDNVEWSGEWAKKALEWLKSPKSVKADVIIKGKQSFPKGDKKEMWEKLLAILEHRFDKRVKEIELLPEGTMYGCNGVINTNGKEESIYTACLYKKP